MYLFIWHIYIFNAIGVAKHLKVCSFLLFLKKIITGAAATLAVAYLSRGHRRICLFKLHNCGKIYKPRRDPPLQPSCYRHGYKISLFTSAGKQCGAPEARWMKSGNCLCVCRTGRHVTVRWPRCGCQWHQNRRLVQEFQAAAVPAEGEESCSDPGQGLLNATNH